MSDFENAVSRIDAWLKKHIDDTGPPTLRQFLADLTMVLLVAKDAGRQASETERLRTVLAPFAKTARGIPDNWPGECHLRIDSEPVQHRDFIGCREWLCYHGVEDVQDACLPTIEQWRQAAAEAGGTHGTL